jgi:hypothetical protein
MLGYHQKFLLEMKAKLNKIKYNPDQLDFLFDFQLSLVLKILHVERHWSTPNFRSSV